MTDPEPRNVTGFLAREWPYLFCIVVVVALAGAAAFRKDKGSGRRPAHPAAEAARPETLPEKEAPGVVKLVLTVFALLAVASYVWLYAATSSGDRIFPETRPPQACWNEWDVIKLLFVAAFLSGLLFLGARSNHRSHSLAASSIAMLATVCVALHVIRSKGREPADVLGLRTRGLAGPMARALAMFFAFLPVLVAARVGAQWLLERVQGAEADTSQEMVVRLATTASPWLTLQIIAAAVFVAPVAEELFFRGLLYGAMRRRVSARVAIPVVGVLFGLIHSPLAVAIPMCALGCLLCYLYEKTARLTVPIVLHLLFNLFSTTMLLAYKFL